MKYHQYTQARNPQSLLMHLPSSHMRSALRKVYSHHRRFGKSHSLTQDLHLEDIDCSDLWAQMFGS